jgi:hemolysin activation/secretion protein
LRVKSSRYFDQAKIKEKAPSLKDGTLPNFKDVTQDIVALNQWPDRRVTPALRAGVTPGTVDVDLNFEDKLPLHGTLEFNNRQSPNTTPLRINATLHYDDLWQIGDSVSFSYQVAPERSSDAEVFSGSYLHRVTDYLSFLTYGLTSSSNVATVGGTNVVGPGQVIGERAVFTLPTREGFFHTISLGADYKHFGQTVGLGLDSFSSPVTYFPAVVTYSATWQQDGALTQLNTSGTFNIRGPGSSYSEFDNKRFDASTSFAHLNADISHTHDIVEGIQLYGKVQGQVGDGPLVSSEQFSLGGLDTVRGYMETEALGDNGVSATLEIRSPNFAPNLQKLVNDEIAREQPESVQPAPAPAGQPATAGQPAPAAAAQPALPWKSAFNELRAFGFADGGYATIYQPLAEQQSSFALASLGVGTRFKTFDYLNGSVVLAFPLISQTYTHAGDPHVLFRVWGEF